MLKSSPDHLDKYNENLNALNNGLSIGPAQTEMTKKTSLLIIPPEVV